MSQSSMIQSPGPTPGYAEHHPLLLEDPVHVGNLWIDSRLVESPADIIYYARVDDSDPAMLIHLHDGAASDPTARTHFPGEISATHIDTVVARGGQNQDEGRMTMRFRGEDGDPIAASHRPLALRVALVLSGSPKAVAGAQQVLAVINPVHTPQFGSPVGPDFQMRWWQDIRPRTWRTWPLSWPDRKDRAGWLSLLTSFLLTLLVASVAVLLAILVFQNQQKVSPPTPVPSSKSATGSGNGSGPPSQSSKEPSSGELSSGGPSGLESRSDTPSMEQPSGGSSGPGSPSLEHKS